MEFTIHVVAHKRNLIRSDPAAYLRHALGRCCWMSSVYVKCFPPQACIRVPTAQIISEDIHPPKLRKGKRSGPSRINRYKTASEGGGEHRKTAFEKRARRAIQRYIDTAASVSEIVDKQYVDGDSPPDNLNSARGSMADNDKAKIGMSDQNDS